MDKDDMIPITDLLVERMERYRSEMNLSQAEFASKIGYSLSGYKKILRCETNTINISKYVQLAKVTEKVFWLAVFYGNQMIEIADIIDGFKRTYSCKIKLFTCIINEKLADDAFGQDSACLISFLRNLDYCLKSESYSIFERFKGKGTSKADNLMPLFNPRNWENKHNRDTSRMSAKQLNQELAYRIERYRVEKGFSQETFAEEIGYSLSGYKKMISGKTRGIPMDIVAFAADVLEKVSLLSFGDRNIDRIALALDQGPASYEEKRNILFLLDTMNLEFDLPQDYIDSVIDTIHELGEMK